MISLKRHFFLTLQLTESRVKLKVLGGYLLFFAVFFALLLVGIFDQNFGVFVAAAGPVGLIGAPLYVWFTLQRQTERIERAEKAQQSEGTSRKEKEETIMA